MERAWTSSRTIACLLIIGLICAPVAPAVAQSDTAKAKARKAFSRGQHAFELGKFQIALKEYEEAYRLSKLPGLLFNIGQCYRNLGNYDQAIYSFRQYLRKVPKARNRSNVRLLLKDLRKKREAKAIEQKRLEKEKREMARKKHEAELAAKRAETERQKREAERLRQMAEAERQKRERDKGSPVYKKWWFWTSIVLALGGGAAGVYFGTRSTGPKLPEDLYGVVELP